MGKRENEYRRLCGKHANLIAAVRADLASGDFVYRLGREGEHARTAHTRQAMEQMVNRVFTQGAPGSSFQDTSDMCDALACLIFHEDEPRIEFLRGLESKGGQRFMLSATSPRIQGACVKLDHGILRAGVTHSARAVFTMDRRPYKQGVYGSLKLVTCYPDADKMEPVGRDDLADIVHGCPAYREGTGVTRVWADLSVEPTACQLACYHTPAKGAHQECLEIDLLDRGVIHQVMATEDSVTWQMCKRSGERAGAALDRLHLLNNEQEREQLARGPYARLIGEAYDRCVEHIPISGPEYAEEDFSYLEQGLDLEPEWSR